MNVSSATTAEPLAESDYIARAHALGPLIAAAAADIEANRKLTDEVVAALHKKALFRLFLPRWLDGGEVAPATFVEVIETIARAHASTAWCLCQMDVCSIASVYLPRAVARDIFAGQGGALAWGSTSNAKAIAAHDGYRVSGDFEFGSGCHHATWLGGHCPVMNADGSPKLDSAGKPVERTLLFPKAAAAITDVWNVIGLRGTGSDMYSLDELFVPEDHAILALFQWPGADQSRLAAPYRFAANNLYAAGFAAVGLGNARGTLEQFIDIAQRKVPRWGSRPLREDPIVQIAVAEAGTGLDAARVYLIETMREAAAASMKEGALSVGQRIKVRAAGTFALRAATQVVDRLYDLAGTTSIFAGNPLERRFRDAHTVSQHLQGRTGHFETVGKHLLGVETELRFV